MFKRLLRPFHPSWSFYTLVFGVIFGIVCGIVTEQAFITGLFWIFLSPILVVLCLRRACLLTAGIIFLVGFILGNFRTSFDLTGQEFVQNLAGRTVTIVGNLAEDPDDSSGKLVIRLQNLHFYTPPDSVENLWKNTTQSVENSSNSDSSSTNQPTLAQSITNPSSPDQPSTPSLQSIIRTDSFTSASGTLHITLSTKVELERSDLIALQGKLDAGFGTFVGKMSRPEVLSVERSDPGDIFAKFKHWFSSTVKQFIPSPEVDLGLGYLMGMKTGLSKDFSTALQAVGMTHVVVASGAHLAILTGAAKKLFGKISKFAGILFSLLMILAFVMIVGFTPSMTRAALVASLSLFAGYFGRKFTPFRLIGFVAMITLLISPMNFLNLGWQLSFASFFGILIVAPRLQRTFYGGKHPPWLASMLITSLATSLLCAPILIFNFGTLSFLSFVANLIILPTLPYAMLGMMLTGTVSFIPPLASIIAQLTTWLLDLHIWLVNFLSEQTAFILELESNNPIFFLLYLSVLFYLAYPALVKLIKPRPPLVVEDLPVSR